MLGLMTSPPTRSTSTIWHQLLTSLAPNHDHHIHDFVAPSQERIHFNFGAAAPRLLLVTSRDDARTGTNTSDYMYFVFDYNSNPHPSCHEECLPPTVSTTKSYFGMRTHRVGKGEFCHTSNTGRTRRRRKRAN
jgi:hypothetical protein